MYIKRVVLILSLFAVVAKSTAKMPTVHVYYENGLAHFSVPTSVSLLDCIGQPDYIVNSSTYNAYLARLGFSLGIVKVPVFDQFGTVRTVSLIVIGGGRAARIRFDTDKIDTTSRL